MDNLCLGSIIKAMKTAFSMIIYFLIASIAGLIGAASIYMICCDLTLLVCGEGLSIFNGHFFVRGMIVSFPFVLTFVLGLVIYYCLRHTEHHFIRLFSYIIMCAFTWLVLIPLSFDLGDKYENAFSERYEIPVLSTGFFRPESGGIWYFSRIQQNGTADGLFIDLAGISGERGSVIKFSSEKIDDAFNGQFADTLIRDAIKLPFVVIAPLEMYSTVIEKGKVAWSRGFGAWLVFLTFALALSSVVAFEYISSWRLINGLIILLAAGIICSVNYIYYHGIIFRGTAETWIQLFEQAAEKHTGFVHNMLMAEEPLLAAINFALFIILLFTGIILYILRERKAGGKN